MIATPASTHQALVRAGHVYCLHATRTNLGPIRKDVNAVWDRRDARRLRSAEVDTGILTEAAAARILSLPMFPELNDAQIGHVVTAIGDALDAT